MKINFVNETDLDVKEYKKLIRSVFKYEKSPMFFNVIFVTKDRIQQINNIHFFILINSKWVSHLQEVELYPKFWHNSYPVTI